MIYPRQHRVVAWSIIGLSGIIVMIGCFADDERTIIGTVKISPRTFITRSPIPAGNIIKFFSS